jgi:hypothetical protein
MRKQKLPNYHPLLPSFIFLNKFRTWVIDKYSAIIIN